MTEAVSEMTGILREVFIDPIRTVLVIDDEFPTLDGLIATPSAEKAAFDSSSPDVAQLRGILQFARTRPKPWLVDVHDGRKIPRESEKVIAPYLHHSDLMVLDYHLEGEDKGGTAAIEILRRLAANNHFNLVIVYTKGDAGGDLGRVLREIALGLTCKQDAYLMSDSETQAIRDALENWEGVAPGIADKLSAEITDLLFLNTLSRNESKLSSIFGSADGAQLLEIIKGKPAALTLDRDLLLKWLLSEKQKRLQPQLSDANLGHIRISTGSDCCWISSEKLFVALLSKGHCLPAEFETKLLAAISSSNPSPHRLLITKMRAEIEERGLVAEAEILRDKPVQTAWLGDFLNPSPADVTSVVSATIGRHWEALGDHLRASLMTFGDRLRTCFQLLQFDEVMKNCGLQKSLLAADATFMNYNCFVSTKPFDRAHLTTGHAFRIVRNSPSVEPVVENWICLSPACDMVPGQKEVGWYDRLGTSIPFIAVRLTEVSAKTAIKGAPQNIYLFLKVNGLVESFCIHKDGNLLASPEWEQMFAADHGRFRDGNKLTLTSVTGAGNALQVSSIEATVIAQLRSEYALNLLQRVGVQLSRPGLGMYFKGRS